MEPANVADLGALEPELLYVFVAGPGTGEGIAVALRGSGWLMLDGCEVGGRSVLSEVHRRFRRGDDDRVLAFFLTHPHEDHARGVPQLLEEAQPTSIWVTAQKPEGPHLLNVCEALVGKLAKLPTSEQLQLRPVKQALLAIHMWEKHTKQAVSCGVDGQAVPLGRSESVRVRAPAQCAHLDTVLGQIARGNLSRANHASMVVEIVDGHLCLVLGGDLPHTLTGNSTLVPTGWDAVMTAYPHLGNHAFLKIAHHGSDAALHNGLMRPPPSAIRGWAVTPFTSKALPRPHVVGDMLSTQVPICVSHPPSEWYVTRRAGHHVRIADILERSKARPTGDPFADAAADVRPDPPEDPLDPLCVFAFDRSGLQSAWLGRSALAILP